MAQYRPPNPLNFAEPNWPKWKAQYETFRLLTDLGSKEEEIQVASLKYCMGPEAEDVIKTFNLSAAEVKKYKTVLDRFDSYFTPRKNVLRLRRTFYRRFQKPQEDTEGYLRALFVAAEDCSFSDKNERIRDQFVAGIINEDLAEKIEMLYFTKDGNLSLNDVVEYSRTYNDVHEGRKLEKEQTKVIDEVKFKPRLGPKSTKTQGGKQCNYCGKVHEFGKCPAFGKKCAKCKKVNHFAAVCKQKERISKVNTIAPLEDENYFDSEGSESRAICPDTAQGVASASGFEEAFLGSCSREWNSENAEDKPWYVSIRVSEGPQGNIVFKVDSGADESLINYETYQKLSKLGKLPPLESASMPLKSPGGTVSIIGVTRSTLRYKANRHSESLHVLERVSIPTTYLVREHQ